MGKYYYNVFITDENGEINEKRSSYQFDSKENAVTLAREFRQEFGENVKIMWFSRTDFNCGYVRF